MSEMRYDAAFASKEVMRDASNPTLHSMQEVKRTARYLKGQQRCVLSFRWALGRIHTLTVMVDSDWVGCTRMRCSTLGGALKIGKFTLKHWSVTQPTIPQFGRSPGNSTHGRMRGRELLGGLTGEPHNLKLLDRQLERVSNLTTTWTRKTSKTL